MGLGPSGREPKTAAPLRSGGCYFDPLARKVFLATSAKKSDAESVQSPVFLEGQLAVTGILGQWTE